MTYDVQRTLTLHSGHTATLRRAAHPESTLWRIGVAGAREHLAHAYTTAYSDHLNLGDLHIKEALHLPVQRGLARLLGRTQLVHLRGHGLGSVLLVEVQREAVQRGLGGVTGTFTPERASDARDLARFYARHGFQLSGTQLTWSAQNGAP